MADEKSHPDAFRHLAPRERILDALLDLSVTEGYESLSEQKILERAGATRADFDANFADLEDCAMQLVDAFLPELVEPVEAAYRAEERWPDSLRAASYVGADWLVTHPREAQFGALEMLKVGELARVRRESVFMSFAYMINAGRERCDDPASAPELVGERAIGSMAEILTRELRHGPPDAHSFVPQLMYLAVLPYLGEEVAREELSIPPPSEQPAPSHDLEDAEREFAADIRERILEAMLQVATTSSYEHTTVEMVCERAFLQRSDFDAHFESLEECALELVDDFFQPIHDSAWAAFDAQERWPDSLRAASYEVADWIEQHPREVRFGAVELPKVSEMGQVRYEQAFKSFTPMIDAGREVSGDPETPQLTGERAVGSVAAMLTKLLRGGAPLEPHRHMRQLMYLAVLPFLGPEVAARELSSSRPGEADSLTG